MYAHIQRSLWEIILITFIGFYTGQEKTLLRKACGLRVDCSGEMKEKCDVKAGKAGTLSLDQDTAILFPCTVVALVSMVLLYFFYDLPILPWETFFILFLEHLEGQVDTWSNDFLPFCSYRSHDHTEGIEVLLLNNIHLSNYFKTLRTLPLLKPLHWNSSTWPACVNGCAQQVLRSTSGSEASVLMYLFYGESVRASTSGKSNFSCLNFCLMSCFPYSNL